MKPKETKKGFKKSDKVKTIDPREGDFHIKRKELLVLGLRVKSDFGSSRVFSLKSFTSGVIAVPFRLLSRKRMTEIMWCFRIGTS